jgi:ferredoxin
MSSREDYNWTNEYKNLKEGLPPNNQRQEQEVKAKENEKVRRVLLLTSYCGNEDNGCTNDFPCDDCLKMCNVAIIEDSHIIKVLGGFDYLKETTHA